MIKIYRNAQFVVLESTNEDGDSWDKGETLFLDKVEKLISSYDIDHPVYKMKGKKKIKTVDLEDIIFKAGQTSDEKLCVKIRNHKSVSGSVPDPVIEITHFDSNEKLDNPDVEYFIIKSKHLSDTNGLTIPGGILKAKSNNFTLHIGKRVNQHYLIILNDDLGGTGGEPPGSGLKIPEN
jgi:hypothetical protein